MDVYFFVGGPLLWVAILLFVAGILTRLAFFFSAIIKNGGDNDASWRYYPEIFGRFFLPFHKAVVKRPIYATLRYLFHICLITVPIWLSGHIVLWSESRFEWEWAALPDAWADWMTLFVIGLTVYFLLRRVLVPALRLDSSISDYFVIVITALAFVTGYFLTHGSLDFIPILGDNMVVIHMLSGEAMVIMVVFLFCRTRLHAEKCIGCAACELSCLTGTIESKDEKNQRILNYSYYQCICCGACVNTCPEEAAQLRHEIGLGSFFQVLSKQEIRSVALKACERCGAFFAPEPQLDKIGQTFTHDYMGFCPKCRKVNTGDVLYELSPWHRKSHIQPPSG